MAGYGELRMSTSTTKNLGKVKRKSGSENAQQECFFKWVRYQPSIRDFIFHIPNGGFRRTKEAAHLKNLGVMPGVSDILVAIPNAQYHGLWIEMKRPDKTNKPSSNQIQFMARMASRNYAVSVCYTWEEAKNLVNLYLANKYDFTYINDSKVRELIDQTKVRIEIADNNAIQINEEDVPF